MTTEATYIVGAMLIVCIGMATIFIRSNLVSIFMGFFSVAAGISIAMATLAKISGVHAGDAELFALLYLMLCFILSLSSFAVMYSRTKNGLSLDEVSALVEGENE